MGIGDAGRRRLRAGRRRAAAAAAATAVSGRAPRICCSRCRAPRSSWSCCRASLRLLGHDALRRPAGAGRAFHPVGQLPWPVRRRPGSGGARRRCCCSSRSACRCSSWSASPGRSEAIPLVRRTASFIFPSTSAIDGLVRINQMDATLGDVCTTGGCGAWPCSMACSRILSARFFMPEGASDGRAAPGNVCSRCGVPPRWLAVAGVRRASARDVPPRRRLPAWSGRPRSASRPEITGRARALRRASASEVQQGRSAGRARQSRAGRLARRSESGSRQRRRPSATGSIPASAPRRSPSRPTACERPRPTCCWPSSRTRAPSRWRPGISPAASSSTSSQRRSPRRRPTSTSSAPSMRRGGAGPIAEERALADAGSRWPEATVADLAGQLDSRDLTRLCDGDGRRPGREAGRGSCPVGKPVLRTIRRQSAWFAFTPARGLTLSTRGGGQRRHADHGTTDGASPPRVDRSSGRSANSRTWRAARAVGDHDLNSFRLRLDPVAADRRRLQRGHDRCGCADDAAIWMRAEIGCPTRSCRPDCSRLVGAPSAHVTAAPATRRGA